MDSGNINANMVEGKVNRVNVVYVDDNGNPKKTGGETPMEVVERELPFQVRSSKAQGTLYKDRLISLHITPLVLDHGLCSTVC